MPLVIIQIILILLKLCDKIEWSWWWVWAPMLLSLVLGFIIVIGVTIVGISNGETQEEIIAKLMRYSGWM